MAEERKQIEYNSQKYDIQDLEYPNDLNSEQYGGHRVVFLINVADESKFRQKSSDNSDVFDIPAAEYGSTAGQRSAATVKPILSTIENAVKENTGIQIELKPTSFSKRLKAAISLYVPNDLSFTYSASWGEEDLSKSENIADTFNKAVDGNLIGALGAVATGVFRQATSAVRNNPIAINAMQQTPGNSKVEQLFQGVDFRSFNFTYDFAPRSEAEAINVMNIISMFKHHMLPEFKDNDQFLFIFPSQFEIKYFKGGRENEFLDKHFTAVCTNCSVNYTANGQFTTFANGMPTHIRMTLGFKEIAIPTKETTPAMFGQKTYKEMSRAASAVRTDRVRGGA